MPTSPFPTPEKYRYRNGFGSYHESEAIPGALPIGQNSPQKPPYGLYAEKLSGTAFTAPRHENQQAWLYRVIPASNHAHFVLQPHGSRAGEVGEVGKDPSPDRLHYIPNQLRWDPFDLDGDADWVRGLHRVAGAGDPTLKQGLSIYIYAAGRDMDARTAFYSADGDLLVVAQHGVLDIQTELGRLLVRPREICVLPRGIRYRVVLPEGPVRGYALELHQGHFTLPELGPIGSNGLANARDFQIPTAAYDVDDVPTSSSASSSSYPSTWTLLAQFAGRLHAATQSHTPFDVVAWHGTYYPYKYDLGRFNTLGSVSYDHPDPSIYTVLTAPSSTDRPGTALADLVLFPPRWLVQAHTFRPPWYHRNAMAEFMGLLAGSYDAKVDGGFRPGGASLHNVMSAHGPDAGAHARASAADPVAPVRVGDDEDGGGSLAFMFETVLMLGVTEWGLHLSRKVQERYNEESWVPLSSHFCPPALPSPPSSTARAV